MEIADSSDNSNTDVGFLGSCGLALESGSEVAAEDPQAIVARITRNTATRIICTPSSCTRLATPARAYFNSETALGSGRPYDSSEDFGSDWNLNHKSNSTATFGAKLLRAFRDRLALENSAADQGALAELDRAGADRVVMEARLAAISVRDGDAHLQDLALSIRQAGLGQGEANRLLIRAWETAVQGALEDGLLSLDEENALARYADHFSLTRQALDRNGVQTSLVQAAVLRDVTQGIMPKRQRVNGAVPFNLMKSEQLVWVIQGVDYLETVVRRERRGTSHGLSIRVARGLYYRPSTFRSRPIEWEETVHADTGMLGLTTKHIYFAGSRKRFRVRYDKIVAFDPFSDGFGIMRDAQTAKPQTFRTGDGWFPYNLAVNLAQIQR